MSVFDDVFGRAHTMEDMFPTYICKYCEQKLWVGPPHNCRKTGSLVTLDELKQLVREIVREELDAVKKPQE